MMNQKVLILSERTEIPVRVADTFWLRLKGLMFDKSLEGGLFFPNVSRVHTNFMLFTIDVVYLDQTMKVLDWETLPAWRIGKKVKQAKHVLELNQGVAQSFKKGEQIKEKEHEY